MRCWFGCGKGGRKRQGERRLGCLSLATYIYFLVLTPTTLHVHHTGVKKKMKKRPRPASSSSSRGSSSSANALVSSSMARVASLAGGPSDEAVARLIALEVCGELDEQERVVMGAGNVDSSRP